MAFTIDNEVHFALDNIPRGPASKDWIEYVGLDCTRRNCLLPWTPLEFVADMHPSIPILDDDLIAYNALERSVQSIEPSEWTSSLSTAQRLAIQVGECVISGFYSTFSNIHQFEPTDEAFRQPAAFLLSCASPWFAHLTKTNSESEIYAPIVLGRSIFHWFRGCLVMFTTLLDRTAHFKASIGRVVSRIMKRGLKSTCTALLWSVRHVAVVVVSADGAVSHSAAIPVVAAFGHDDEAMRQGLALIAHYLQPPVISGEKVHRGKLPMDIMLHIGLTSGYALNSFRSLSHATRCEWSSLGRIDGMTLLGSSSDSTYFRVHEGGATFEARLSRYPHEPGRDIERFSWGEDSRVRLTGPDFRTGFYTKEFGCRLEKLGSQRW